MAKKISRARARATSTDDENSPRIPLGSIIIDDITGDISFTIFDSSNNDGNDTHIFISEEADLGFAQEVYIYSEGDSGEQTIVMVPGSSIKQAIVIIEDNDPYSGNNIRERYDALLITPINGDQTANVLIGTDFGDAVYGRKGDDLILGLDGENSLYGWQDDDLIIGGSRPDILVGGAGNDRLYGGANLSVDYRRFIGSTDLLDGGEGSDLLDGGSGVDELYGGTGNDLLRGGHDNDTLEGEAGADRLDGGNKADAMYGGLGNDTFSVDDEGDRAYDDAGGGIDTVISSVSYYFGGNEGGEIGGSTLPNQVVENLLLDGDEDIWGAGNTLDNTIIGNSGDNQLVGNDGNDVLIGDNSKLLLFGADTLFGGLGNDALVGGKGKDTLWGSGGSDGFIFVGPNSGLDDVRDFDPFQGDKIYVSLEKFGNVANDFSRFTYDAATRTLSFDGKAFARFQDGVNFSINQDIVLSNNLPSQFASIPTPNVSRANVSPRLNIRIDTSRDGNVRGSKADDMLAGMEGADLLYGEAGNDVLEGGLDADSLQGGDDRDRLFGEFGNDSLAGEDGNDSLSGGRDNDFLGGGRNDDALYGGEDNDILAGGSGKDWFTFYRPANVDVRVQRDESGTLTSVQLTVFQDQTSPTLKSLTANQFHIGKTAADELDRVIYDDATGALYFDVDGTGNYSSDLPSVKPIPIAKLPVGLSLTAEQILAEAAGFNPASLLVEHKPYSDGVDRITDFDVNDDVIGIYVGSKIISPYRAAGLPVNSVLSRSQFKVGARATKASQRFIYDDRNGSLYFDRDGTGSLAPVQIAKFDRKPALSYKNIRTFNDAKADQLNQADMITSLPTVEESWG